MTTIPTNRTTANTPSEHVSDHNILHHFNNEHPTDPAAHIGTYVGLVTAPTGVAATDTAVIQAAVTAAGSAGGGTVILSVGTYVVNAHITVPDKVTVRGSGMDATTISFSVDLVGQAIFGFGGSVSGSDAAVLTANTSVGVTGLTVGSTASLVAGSYYILGADSAFSTENPLRYKGELIRVFSVDSGTGITLYSFVRDIYTTATAASIRLVSYHTGNGISDLTIKNTAPATGTTAGVTFQACKDVRVSNIRTEGLDNQGINLVECLGGTIVGYQAQDHTDDEANSRFGYGVNIGRATENVTVTGCHFRRVRHGFTCDGSDNQRGVPRNIVVSGCTAAYCTSAAFDSHATGQFITYDGCSVTQGDHGFQVRAQDVRILSSSVSHCTTGVNVKADANGLRIAGCVFRHLRGASAGTGITIPNSPDRVTISHNTFDALAGHGILISGNAKRVKILHNEFSNIGTGGSRTKGVVWSGTICPENLVAFNTFVNETPTAGEADMGAGGTMTVAIDLGGTGVTTTKVLNNVAIGVPLLANLTTNTAAGNTPTGTYLRSGIYYSQPSTLSTSSTLGNSTLRAEPFPVGSGVTLDRIAAEITSAGDAGRSVANMVTNGTTTITSATAAFVSTDQGRLVTGTNLAANTYIASVTNGTTAVLTIAATGSGSGGTLNISGAQLRLGLYADDGNGYPGALVLDAGSINGNSATVQEITISTPVTAGLYWRVGVVQGVTTTQPTVRTNSSQQIGVGTTLLSQAVTIAHNSWSATGVPVLLPDPFPAGGTTSAASPRIAVRAV